MAAHEPWFIAPGRPFRDPVAFHNRIFSQPTHIKEVPKDEKPEWRRRNIRKTIALSALILTWQHEKARTTIETRGISSFNVSIDSIPPEISFFLGHDEWVLTRALLSHRRRALVRSWAHPHVCVDHIRLNVNNDTQSLPPITPTNTPTQVDADAGHPLTEERIKAYGKVSVAELRADLVAYQQIVRQYEQEHPDEANTPPRIFFRRL